MNRVLLVMGLVVLLGAAGTACANGDVEAGKAKAASCAGCHGANGEGKGSYPALAGKSQKEIEQALEDYKSGKRNNAIMHSFADRLSDKDIDNVAAYYASLKAK
ncbi:MAG TPA: cytochrome c [Casimicrobiaceae bacterium]|jgi:cytochrome c553